MTEPIQISTAARDRPGEDAQPTAGRILAECRIRLLKFMHGGFSALFDQLDDTLFQLADQSDNNADQTRYFDAMRELRLKRGDIEQRFRDGCTRRFHEPEATPAAITTAPAEGAMTLSLVANDDLEEALAIDNLVTKIEAECADELDALDQRMAALAKVRPRESTANPVAPRAVCDAFRDACSVFETGIETKLLVFKLFDRVVAADLPDCYHDLNDYLATQGVLPVVRKRDAGVTPRPAAHRRPTISTPGGIHPGTGMPGSGASASGFAGGGSAGGWPVAGAGQAQGYGAPGNGFPALDGLGGGAATDGAVFAGGGVRGFSAQDLLATLHQVMTAQGARALAAQGAAEADIGATVRALTTLQQGVGNGASGSAGDGAAMIPGVDAVLLADGATNVLRGLRDGPVGREMGQVDGMMIDIVAMLFDSILDDPAIPGPLKALIGRLQIPVLKVAILDKSFFSRKFHPARELLNKLAETALGAGEDIDENDPLYLAIHAIVHRILDEFEDDVRMFKRAVQELETYRANERRDADSRLAQSLEEAQAEERLRFARQVAGEQVARHTAQPGLSPVVREFLEVYWKSFLQLAYIDQGEEGADWQAGITVMDELVWSLTPKADADERAHLKALLPDLLGRLRQGMVRLSIPEEFRKRLTRTLVHLHLDAIKPPAALGTATPVAAADDGVGDSDEGDDGATVALGAVTASDAQAPIDADDPLGAACSDAGVAVGEEIVEEIVEEAAAESDDDASRLCRAIAEANRRVLETAAARPECEGMGTTVVATRFAAGVVSVAHVGDSRLYRQRDGRLEQITLDHSLRQELVNQGFYTPEEARVSTRKNYITRAVGVDETVRPDSAVHELAAGDIWLLCSDGLCDMVEDEAMQDVLASHADDLEGAVQALVDAANANGGKDNISVILVGVEAGGECTMAALSDTGCTRPHNEDFIAVDPAQGLALLADGMGGYNAGEVASEMTVTTLLALFGAGTADADGGGIDINELVFGESMVEIDSLTLTPDSVDIDLGSAAEAADDDAFPPLEAALDDDCGEIEEIEILDVGAAGCAGGDDEHLAAARKLAIGDWVEFGDADGKRLRARLAWVSSATGVYLFCNRNGHKVVDTTPQGLAVEFRRGSARVLDSVPLFDRAVSSLMGRLHGDDTAQLT